MSRYGTAGGYEHAAPHYSHSDNRLPAVLYHHFTCATGGSPIEPTTICARVKDGTSEPIGRVSLKRVGILIVPVCL